MYIQLELQEEGTNLTVSNLPFKCVSSSPEDQVGNINQKKYSHDYQKVPHLELLSQHIQYSKMYIKVQESLSSTTIPKPRWIPPSAHSGTLNL